MLVVKCSEKTEEVIRQGNGDAKVYGLLQRTAEVKFHATWCAG